MNTIMKFLVLQKVGDLLSTNYQKRPGSWQYDPSYSKHGISLHIQLSHVALLNISMCLESHKGFLRNGLQ